jgi:subtilisin family serine protease
VVAYPALHPDTIGVGASTNFDYRADYSRYGFGLDFVAPSGGGSESIYTTDRTDTSVQFGDDGNYTYFSGTSAASPLAAAVGALMLSANPDLTAQEVRDIMQETCDPIGNAPYNEINDSGFNTNSYFGHGRINAGLAVTAAKEMAGK